MSSSGNERRGGSEIQFDKNDQEGEVDFSFNILIYVPF